MALVETLVCVPSSPSQSLYVPKARDAGKERKGKVWQGAVSAGWLYEDHRVQKGPQSVVKVDSLRQTSAHRPVERQPGST